MARMLLLGILVCGLGACAEPFIVFPGEALKGEASDPPADWSEMRDVEVVQLETLPEDPYSVHLWVAAIGPDIYVATGEDGTNWTENLAIDRDVRLRVNGRIYELEAQPIEDREERARVVAEYIRKYDVDVDESWVFEGLIFRLDRR